MGLGEKALRVSQNAMLLEEFLFKQFEAGELDALSRQLKTAKADFLVHGHCHQKAISTMENTLKLLDLIPQSKTRLVESSCCGMAGSFGYDAATIEVSAKMAQLTLIPSLLNEPNAIWVADGFSCRHQIENLTGRKPVHVCELLAMHLPTS
jgi:Fe-S oxidoreductase